MYLRVLARMKEMLVVGAARGGKEGGKEGEGFCLERQKWDYDPWSYLKVERERGREGGREGGQEFG